MRTRTAGFALTLVLLTAAPASGEATPKVPRPQIQDPAGDSNALNSYGGVLPLDGDHSTPVDLTGADILAAWFTHDAKTISAHIRTEAPPPGEASYLFVVTTNPGDGCMHFGAVVEGPTSNEGPSAYLSSCMENKTWNVDQAVAEASDGTGIITITVPRSLVSGLSDGHVLKSPAAFVQEYTFALGPVGHAHFLIIDDTKVGRDYRLRKRGR